MQVNRAGTRGGRVYMLHCQKCNVEMFNIWYNRRYCSSKCQSEVARDKKV